MKPHKFFSFIFFTALFVLFTSILSASGYVEENSVITSDSTIEDCAEGPEIRIVDSLINKSSVKCGNITNVTMYDSRISNPSRNITDAVLEFAVISENILQSGKMVYGIWTYYGPFNLDNIYAGVPPSDSGIVGTSVDVVGNGSSFYVTYTSGEVGYTAELDASEVGGASSIPLLDGGLGNDLNANDGIYTSTSIEVDYSETGYRTLTVSVDDGFGNEWEVTTQIYVDNEPPTGSITIDPDDETDNRVVSLILTSGDNYEVESCRLGNSIEELEANSFGLCPSSIPWILSPFNGEKTVHYQVKDKVGNIYYINESVTLNLLTFSEAPSVDDYVDYWGYDDRVRFKIYYDIPIDTSSLTYDYRIYNSSCTTTEEFDGDICNITPWRHTEIKEIWDYDVSLEEGINYTIGARALSGGVSDQGFSDGFNVVLSAPTFNQIESSIDTWTSGSIVPLNLSATDAVSGISGFSYRISTTNLVPNDVIDIYGNDVIVYLTGLGPGHYNFTAKARNNARLFSEVVSFTFSVDTIRPTIPYAERPLASGTGALRFNWTPSTAFSGIEGYEVIVATDSFFENIVAENFTANTYIDFISTAPRTYYFKVRALSNAGLYSLYSDKYDAYFDVTPPKFVNKKPRGLISNERPILQLQTNERTECFYGTEVSNMEKFEFTGGFFHEQIVSLEAGTFTYIFRCVDTAGNENSTTIEFQIDPTKTPTIITPSESSITSFSSEFYHFNISIKSSSSGLGELNLGRFIFLLDNKEYGELWLV